MTNRPWKSSVVQPRHLGVRHVWRVDHLRVARGVETPWSIEQGISRRADVIDSSGGTLLGTLTTEPRCHKLGLVIALPIVMLF